MEALFLHAPKSPFTETHTQQALPFPSKRSCTGRIEQEIDNLSILQVSFPPADRRYQKKRKRKKKKKKKKKKKEEKEKEKRNYTCPKEANEHLKLRQKNQRSRLKPTFC